MVPDQYLSIDTTSYTPSFSSGITFKYYSARKFHLTFTRILTKLSRVDDIGIYMARTVFIWLSYMTNYVYPHVCIS